jgi:hypothetical protein
MLYKVCVEEVKVYPHPNADNLELVAIGDDKFILKKADGSPIDPEAKYIVLRYDANNFKDGFAARHAIRKYAKMIQHTNPVFALDLLKAVKDEYIKELLAQTAN